MSRRPVVGAGDVEQEHLAHAHPHRAAVVRVDAGRVEDQRLDAEGPCRAGDQPEVLGIVESLEHGDTPGTGDDLGDRRKRSPVRRSDHAAVEVEPDRAGDDVVVGDENRHGSGAGQGLDPSAVLGRDEDGADLVRRLDQSLHGDQTLGDEHLVALAPAAGSWIGEIEEVGEPLVVGIGDRHVASGKA